MPTFDGEQLMGQISRHVFLVLLRVSWPKMSYKISDAIVEVNVQDSAGNKEKKEIAEEFRTRPQWQLMPENWRKRLVNLEGRVRTMMTQASIQFAARGMAVLPVSRAREVFSGLRTLRDEMYRQRDAFVADYAEILDKLAERLDPALYRKVAHKLPNASQVRTKFEVVWAIVPAGGGALSESDLLTFEALLSQAPDCERMREAQEAARELIARLRGQFEADPRQISHSEAADLIEEAQSQMHEFTQEMLENMAREPREILQAASNNLLEALANPDRAIRNGTINQVREAFDMVRGFNFLAGPQLLTSMREVQNRLDGATPQQLNADSEIGARLAEGLTAVRDAAADAEESSMMVRQFRNIRIRPREEED